MANANGWGDGASNNNIGWGKGADNAIGWGAIHADSWAGLTDIVGTPAVDPDAQAFITAASITDPTQQSAINQLVVDLKGYNIWTKMKALYPIVGGTAAQHKWNLKDPRDLDAAFRLVFNGGWTHSSTGALPNGTNGFTDTKLNPQNDIGSLNISFGIYIPNTHKATSGHGVWDSISRRTNLLQFSGYYSQITTNATQAYFNSNSNGFIQASRTSSSSNKLYRNGSLLNTNTSVETTQLATNGTFYFSFINGSTGSTDYGSNELRFAYISTGLTDTEAANFYTAVQAFQVSLNRQV